MSKLSLFLCRIQSPPCVFPSDYLILIRQIWGKKTVNFVQILREFLENYSVEVSLNEFHKNKTLSNNMNGSYQALHSRESAFA